MGAERRIGREETLEVTTELVKIRRETRRASEIDESALSFGK